MKKTKLVIIFIIAYSLTNITNIKLCNAIEVMQQDSVRYLIFEPDSLNEEVHKVIIERRSKYKLSYDGTKALMNNPHRFKDRYLPLQIFDQYGQVTGEIQIANMMEFHISNKGIIVVHGNLPTRSMESPSGFWVYNMQGELIYELERTYYGQGVGKFSYDCNMFAITINTTSSLAETYPGILLLFDDDFSTITTYDFEVLISPQIEFSADGSRIKVTFKHVDNFNSYNKFKPQIKKTIIFDSKLNVIEEKKGWESRI